MVITPIGIIINPISGSTGHRTDAARARVSAAERGARDCGVEIEIALTESRGHAGALAADFVARGMDVVAWGGDGTGHEAAGPLIGTTSSVGIVPCGSGDGLARGLGLSFDPVEAVRTALVGRTRPIDVCYLGDKHFVNIAGIGFDAAVAASFNVRRTRGLAGYASTVLRIVWQYVAEEYDLSFDGGPIETKRRLLIGFANAPQYGSGLVLAPDANPSDGAFNIVTADAAGPLRQLWRMRQIVLGSTRPIDGVDRQFARTARVTGSRLVCHVDGEPFETTGSLDVRISPSALRVRVPEG